MNEVLATLCLAEPVWRLSAAWIICGLAVLAGLGGRRRLPAGVSEGLFVAGLSGILLAAYLPMRDPERSVVQLSAVLTALAVLWRFAPQRAGGGTGAAGLDSRPPLSELEKVSRPPFAAGVVRSYAVLLCGAAVAGLSLRVSPDAPREQRLAVTLCLVLMLALALRPRSGWASGVAWYAPLGLLACALRIWVLPYAAGWPANVMTMLVCAGGVLSLGAALVPVLAYWRNRRRGWQLQTERLLEPPPPWRLWWTGVQVLAGLTGIAALVVRDAPLAAFGPALAAIGASVAGFRQRAVAGGSLALVLASEAAILATLAWLPDFGFNALAGATLAGLWMIWLSRFWTQQLHEGQAWTYTGHLVGPARRIGCAAAVVCLALAVSEVAGPAAVPAISVPQMIWSGVTFLLLVRLARMLGRDAGQGENWLGPFAACFALLAALVPLEPVVATLTRSWPTWPVLLAVGLLLMALLGSRKRGRAEVQDWLYDAHIGGFLPVAIVCAGWTAGAGPFWFGILAVALVAFGLRWPRSDRPDQSTAPPSLSASGCNL
ncbi:MAG: hypothetical protein KBH81_04635 [Phycisphaerae bacterium]|nr:hypothetical protein [Phycisphaerae bacterium]HPC23031.1 hypothetical protein [Phycisphaerae bacterium]HRS28903.1 hypothetical protein [Phycisphaerae bacterium]HRT42106.1 hypothetical protein [Phycisphaerae bacterium]